MATEIRTPDATLENHGSLWLLRPLTDAAREWIDTRVAGDAQRFGDALVIEPRYVEPLVGGMLNDGLVVA